MICGMTYYQILLFFVLYSFLGWCVEVAFHAVKVHRVINRGFLNGPVCPVYGFGVIAVFATVNMITARREASGEDMNLVILFLIGMGLATLVELIGGYALDRFFHARWWDYSRQPLNFHGYICLKFSLIWGAAIVLVVKIFHPLVGGRCSVLLPERIGWWILAFMYVVYLADFIVSVMIMLQLNREIQELDEIRSSMRRLSDSITMTIGEGTFLAEDLIGERKLAVKTMAGIAPDEQKQHSDGQEHTDTAKKEPANTLETREEFEVKKELAIAAYEEKTRKLTDAAIQKKETLTNAAVQTRESLTNAAIQTKETLTSAAAQTRENLASAAVQTKETLVSTAAHRKDSLTAAAVQKKADLTSAAQKRRSEAVENLRRMIREAEEKRAAWYARLYDSRHVLMRFFLSHAPRFIHQKYQDTLEEVYSNKH
ncbi:MAG: hypothetical protein IKE03_07145 [Blautia sp.]|nr:hypothetical protein [Blautia sp.]